jgi:DNA-binding helix-hairpin-helix protein with protein kinase domain
MPTSVQLKNGTTLQLEHKAFASGGEGELFRITNPISFQNQVVKIYKLEKRTKERENKTEFLATNPPTLQVHDGHHSVIWVNQVVFDNGKFCGFTMPIAKGEKLELLCHPQLPKTLNNEWAKFDFQSPKAIELRLKLCFNIAVALYHIHKLSNYVLVDMKPENIMVQPNGLISLIDIDSVAIVKNNKVIFPAPVATPEYTPPEYYKGIKLDGDGINETWDRFSMSIIFYRLLCGIHPFTGSCITPYEKCNGLADMVQNGLFPNGLKSSYFKVIPPPHNKFKNLDSVVQELFKRCFNEGHSNPNNRPNADEWCRSLSPQQVIQINRPLPSSTVIYPMYNYSKAIVYNPSTSLELPNINYANPQSQKGLKALLSGLFGKNKEQQFIDTVKQQEKELKQKERKYEVFVLELQDIITAFSKTQETILIKEKSKVEQLKKTMLLDISYFDKQAKELHIQEANEINAASSLFTNSSNALEQRIKQTYTNILGKRFENQEIQKSGLQKNIQDLQIQEQNEINSFINNPTKLSKYIIKNASIHNFGYSTNQSLAAVGIITAADFTDIDSGGFLKNRLGKWVKANGVGWSRAYDLREWQRKLELKENQIITQNVNQNYLSRFLLINNSIKNMDAAFQKEIHPFQIQYNREKMAFDEAKTKLNKTYKEKLEEIKTKYNKLHLVIIENCKIYTNTISPKAKIIAAEIEKELNDNFQKYISQFASKKTEINNYTTDLKSEISKLTKLHQQLTLQTN